MVRCSSHVKNNQDLKGARSDLHITIGQSAQPFQPFPDEASGTMRLIVDLDSDGEKGVFAMMPWV